MALELALLPGFLVVGLGHRQQLAAKLAISAFTLHAYKLPSISETLPLSPLLVKGTNGRGRRVSIPAVSLAF
jgi:hypothetical protein